MGWGGGGFCVVYPLAKLVSVPLIFFSLLSTLTGMGSMKMVKRLGGLVFRYTLLTTVVAACVALGLFLLIDPVGVPLPQSENVVARSSHYQHT